MPIKGLTPRLQEGIRIRTGYRGEPNESGKRRPVASETFILTSAHQPLILACAEAYGGAPEIWDEPTSNGGRQFKVITDRRHLDVLLPPAPNLWSQWMERWTAAGCLRRCDGEWDEVNKSACDCPKDWSRRKELAKTGQACKETTRLTVLLKDLPELVGARLESHSYHTAVEMLASAPYWCSMAYERGMFIPGRLAIEQREGTKVPGQPTPRFKVVSFQPALGAVMGTPGLTAGDPVDTRALPAGSVVVETAPVGQPDTQSPSWPPRDPDRAPDPSIGLAALARELRVSQSDVLRHARELAQAKGLPLPATIAEVATSDVADDVRRWLTDEIHEPF